MGVCYFGVRSTRGAGGGAPPHAPAALVLFGRAAVVPFVVSSVAYLLCGRFVPGRLVN